MPGKYVAVDTSSVAERWPKLTVIQLAQGQNKINGNIYAANHQLCAALEEVMARLTALEAKQAGFAASKAKKTTAADKKLAKAKRFVNRIGGKQPPGCSVPTDL
jgi:conjugal transfer/entry exclusion protein